MCFLGEKTAQANKSSRNYTLTKRCGAKRDVGLRLVAMLNSQSSMSIYILPIISFRFSKDPCHGQLQVESQYSLKSYV
jgi:hypothetical protein